MDRGPFVESVGQVHSLQEDQVLPTEWSLLTRVFEVICKVFDRLHLNLFTTRVNAKLPLHMSPVPDPMA